jgi:tetratricopeptide (TPR) repeat protein
VAGGEQLIEQARASYEAGDVRASRELALAGLAERPDDPALLRLAGRASSELGLDDATVHLARAATLDPDDAETWHDLAGAYVDEGKLAHAEEALKRVLQLRPDDPAALVDLGHISYAVGNPDVAIGYLRRAADRNSGNVGALRGLAGIYRRMGKDTEALEAAREVCRLEPDDVVASLELAELSLELGRLDEAGAEFGRLRTIDDEPEHEVYAFHGMIEAELRRERWRRALDLAVDATRVDRLGRTTDLLAFVVAQVFGAGERPAPSRKDVEEALATSRTEHRRLHEEPLAL